MPKSNVKVIVRARPSAHYASEIFQFDEASDSIDMRTPKDDKGAVNNQKESWHFKLDKVLANATQEHVFDICACEVVKSVMDGYNGTILAYGQTGAGKTHTMTGGQGGFQDRGIVVRAISAVFQEASARPENATTVKLSYAEIYNELIFDLLNDAAVTDQSGDLQIVENSRGMIEVRGLTTAVTATEEEAMRIFFEGDRHRHVAEHALNKGSSRSHCVFTIYVESRSRVESTEKVIASKLNLVDLAGSERVKKTGTDGTMLREATYINKSLSFLEQVVVALGSKHRDQGHVPYRQSKLTHMLKDSLGGNCKTTMIANVWPEANKIEETASTLHFATRMMRVANEASVNVHLDPQLLIRKYERQIKDLKQELAMHDTLAGRSREQYEEYSPDEVRELQGTIQRYIDGEVQEVPITSLRMVYESFNIFRSIHLGLKKELAERPEPRPVEGSAGDGAAGAAAAAGAQGGAGAEGEVGEDEEGRGISVGQAPSHSRPAQDDRSQGPTGELGDYAEGDRTALYGAPQASPSHYEQPPDKQTCFCEWKAAEGIKFEEDFEQKKEAIKECKADVKETTMIANAKKRLIDEAQERLHKKQAEKDTSLDEEMIDEEEYSLIKQLKDLKQEYRMAFEKNRQVRMDTQRIEQEMQQAKLALVKAFEDSYEQRFGSTLQRAAETNMPKEGEGDIFDPQEQFDMAQAERLETQHPDALAYHKAKKSVARTRRR